MSEQIKTSKKLPTWQEFQQELIARAIKDECFRKELLDNPKAVLEKEMGKLKNGAKFPAALEIKVLEQPANTLYLVLPTVIEELSDEALDAVAGGGCLWDCEV